MIRRFDLPGFRPEAFFRKLRATEKHAACAVIGTWIIIAWDPSRTIAGDDPARVTADLKRALSRRSANTTNVPFSGGWLGWISYDAALSLRGVVSRHRKTRRTKELCFHRYDNALLWDGARLFVVGSSAFARTAEAIHRRPLPPAPATPLSWKRAMSPAAYGAAFRRVMRLLFAGDVYQLNLSLPWTAPFSGDTRQLFSDMFAAHPSSNAAYVECGSSALLSLSPETFITVRGDVLETRPIKGTRPRGGTAKEDNRLKRELLSDPKERAELAMITDLLRNDVGVVSRIGSVRVEEERSVRTTSSVWHTESTVTGRLRAEITPIDALLSMLPGGSVTGCPKSSAMEEIDRLEVARRGLYCGTFVVLPDDGSLHSSVLIRSIEASRALLTLGTGGGIVTKSDRRKEEHETLVKIAPFLSLQGRRTWVDGKETDRHPLLTLLDPACASSRGVFETMVARDARIRNLAWHLARLQKSAAVIGFRISKHRIARLRRQLRSVLTKNPSRVKIRGPLGPRLTLSGSRRMKVVCTENHCVIETAPLRTDPRVREGIAVSVTPLTRTMPEAKALPYHREWRAYSRALLAGFHETLLRSRNGEIPEASISNLFFAKNGTLHTAGSGMLPGITRGRVLTLARRLKIPVRFSVPTERDLFMADEVFLTRSTVGILPVLRIGKRRIARGVPGPITTRLSAMLDPA